MSPAPDVPLIGLAETEQEHVASVQYRSIFRPAVLTRIGRIGAIRLDDYADLARIYVVSFSPSPGSAQVENLNPDMIALCTLLTHVP
eukprot:COSAG02_NODE_2249_length_9371_cov_6.018550_10_plen_87_part_00